VRAVEDLPGTRLRATACLLQQSLLIGIAGWSNRGTDHGCLARDDIDGALNTRDLAEAGANEGE